MIVLTTPTGNIGSQLLGHLLDANANSDSGSSTAVGPIRVIVRDPARLPARVRERVEVIAGSHGDPEVVAKAFAGADTVFWLAPPNPKASSLDAAIVDFARPAVEAIVQQGVRRVISVSALGRGTPVASHAGLVTATLAVDDLIAATGVAFRPLVLPGFMDNTLRQAASIREQGVYFTTADVEQRYPTCATRDIAAVAARLVRDPDWTGQDTVAVLGPEDISAADMAATMSDVLGRPVRCQQITVDDQRKVLAAQGWSAPMTQAMIDMLVAKNAGLDLAEPRTPASTTPTTFRAWCEDGDALRPTTTTTTT